METKNLSFNGMDLPAYLGYGILDQESIRYQKGELHAEYVFECDGSVVHRVTWNDKNCKLETFCHGERGNFTICPDLRYAMLYDSRSWDLSKDYCYLFLAREISRLGNIYVNLPQPDEKKSSADFYPAGKIFVLSLPIAEKTQKYSDFLGQIKNSDILRFSREKKGHTVAIDKNLKADISPITIADFDSPAAHLYNAAKEIVNAGIIDKRKFFPLIINECYNAENLTMKTLTGDKLNPQFMIVFKEFSQDKLEHLAGIIKSPEWWNKKMDL